jgi:carbamoyl-phosphate synthase large subunit
MQALVREHDVRLVVPLTDLDQELLSRCRAELEPALVLVPPPEVCRTMGDKYLAHLFFEEHGIASPRSWLPGEVPADARYPLLVKVREGFGSRHIYRAADPDELGFFLRYTTVDSFVQEVCRGEEFSIDVFCDLDARCLNAIPRTMIMSKGGESIRGMSIQDAELIEHGARVAETVGIVGPANVQCFREPGERPEPRLGDFREGVLMTRFFSDLCLTRDGDDLVPFAEELPHPLAAEPGEG